MNLPAHIMLKFETGAVSHVGRVRKANEDSFITRPDLGLWAVADGVGGHDAGKQASETVVEDLDSVGIAVSLDDQIARFQSRILRANATIHEISEQRGGGIMGTTVVSLLTFDQQFAIIWAGDSRAYLLRAGTLHQLSNDHSEVQELVDQGVITKEQAKTWPRRNVITRAIGIFEDPNLECVQGEIESGDVFLLCSDGLTGHISDEEIAAFLTGRRAQEACDELIEKTLERGATDNVTVIAVRCHHAERTNFIPGNAEPSRGPV